MLPQRNLFRCGSILLTEDKRAVLVSFRQSKMKNVALYVNSFMEVLTFGLLFAIVYLLIKLIVVDKIKRVNYSLKEITGGKLNEVVDVDSTREFAFLSQNINSTVDEAFNRVNNVLCEGNDAGMFVTAWQGKVNLNSGEVVFTNAGHNPPIIIHADGAVNYLEE